MEDLRWPVRFYPRPVPPAVLIECPHDAMLSPFDETDAFSLAEPPETPVPRPDSREFCGSTRPVAVCSLTLASNGALARAYKEDSRCHSQMTV